MAARLIQASLAAGELSPALYGRVDLEKYHSAAAKMRNWFVDYRGGANTRPGTEFVGACHNVPGIPRLIPFIVSTLATYVLEFGDHYIRFISNGAYLAQVLVSPYADGDLPVLKYVQSANVLTLTHPSYPVYNLTRVNPTTFAIDLDSIEPDIGITSAPPTVTQVNGTGTFVILYGYVITAISPTGEEGIQSFPGYVAGEILDQNTGIINDINWPAVDGAQSYRIYKIGPTASGIGNDSSPASSVFGFIGSSNTVSFVDNNIAPDYSQTPPTFQDPFSPGQVAQILLTGFGSSYADPSYPLIFTGDGTGASGYVQTDRTSGLAVGVVITNPGKNYSAVTVTDSGPNTATYSAILGQQSGTYPAAVGYFQQRRVFGGTNNFPESMVMSQPGQYDNFNTSPVSLDSDAITASIASQQVNAIKSFTAMPTGLVVLTTGGGFLVSGGGQNAAVTPSNIVALPQASPGCNDLPPLIINADILYGQNRGSAIRDLAFNFYVQAYTGTDRSVLASHLFTNYKLIEWAYAEEPFRLVQVVRNDGRLLNFTYVPEQEIFAWTPWDTNGFFVSIASIPEGNENAVYVVVQRNVNGGFVYYTERFASRVFEQVEDTWCLDSALAEPLTFPAAAMAPRAGTGSTIIDATAGIFVLGDVGKIIWAGGGQAIVTAYVSPTAVAVDVLKPFPLIPDDPYLRPIDYIRGAWSMDTPVTHISGLDHLEAMVVWAVADGMPQGPFTVVTGAITLPQPATKIVVGLPFQCQLQTLRLDTGEPTTQGKRKQISAVTVRVNQTKGLTIGPDFDHLVQMNELTYPYSPGPNLVSGDLRTTIQAQWNKEGYICFEQNLPLPASILAIIPEVVLGDTAR